MKVILTQDVRGQGKRGQMIEVSDGYARNFLFPKKLAQEANADNVNTMKMNDKARQEREAKERAEAMDISKPRRSRGSASDLEELAQSGEAIPGLSTGLHDLDRKINGLNRTDLLLIAARPGMGKTSMALNIALNVAKKYPGKAVAFFNLEMSR